MVRRRSPARLFLNETTDTTSQYNFLLTTWRKNLTSSWKDLKRRKEFSQSDMKIVEWESSRRQFFKSFFGFPNQTVVKMKIQNQISRRWNPFSDFAFDCRSEIRILNFKFGFPNPTHPKESCFLVRCLLESKLSRNHFRAAKELDRNLRNTALTVHAFPSRERAPCSFFGSLVAWTFPRGCKKKRFLTESEKFRSNYESYLSITW